MAQQQQFGMFGPSNDPWAETFAQLDAGAGRGAQFAIGSLAGRGTAQLMGGFGFKPAAVQRQEQINEAMKAARDPGGDMLTTYKNLAHELHSRGLVEEAMKAEQMYSDAQIKKQEFDLKQEDIQSKILQRQELTDLRQKALDLKAQGKGWFPSAEKFMSANMKWYTPESWKNFLSEMNKTGGDYEAAIESLVPVPKEGITYSKPTQLQVPDGKGGMKTVMVQEGSNGKLSVIDGTGQTINVEAPGVKGASLVNSLVKDVVPQKYTDDTINFSQLSDTFNLAKQTTGSGSARAWRDFETAWAKANKADPQISAKEAKELKNFGPLGQRILASINTMLSGRPTSFQIAEYETMLAVRRKVLEEIGKEHLEDLDKYLSSEVTAKTITPEQKAVGLSKLTRSLDRVQKSSLPFGVSYKGAREQ